MRPTQRLTRLLCIREALIHARLGDGYASQQALDDATDTLFAGPDEADDPMLDSWLGDVNEEWLTIRAGMVLLRLGDAEGALDHFSALLNQGPSWRRRTHPATAFEFLEAADALLAVGDIESAVSAVQRASEINGTLPPGYVHRVRGRFSRYLPHVAVKDLLVLVSG